MDIETVKNKIIERTKDTFLIEDDGQDTYIANLATNAFNEYCLITGALEVLDVYLMVIEGVVNKRYVRRGSEGLTSENSDGYSVSYKADESDFAEYYPLLAVNYDIKVGAKRRPSVGIH